MAIYTKTGDTGKTSIFGGRRIAKSHPQVNAYGTIDELSCQIGLICSTTDRKEEQELLITIQKDLWQMMAILAGAEADIQQIEQRLNRFESEIDRLDAALPQLKRFVLPGGTQMSSWYHVLRAVCRRSEREVVAFFLSETPHSITEEDEATMLRYLNRLSDLFFMMARDHANGTEIST
jgi:cob(I)alamin adenosyltransferase